MNEPTKQQIDQAERLQAAGLCKNARNTIKFVEWLNGDSEHMLSTPFNGHRTAMAIGPLPTFEEVWVELVEYMKGECYVKLYSNALVIAGYSGELESWMFDDGHTPTTAAIEALLLLKGELT